MSQEVNTDQMMRYIQESKMTFQGLSDITLQLKRNILRIADHQLRFIEDIALVLSETSQNDKDRKPSSSSDL